MTTITKLSADWNARQYLEARARLEKIRRVILRLIARHGVRRSRTLAVLTGELFELAAISGYDTVLDQALAARLARRLPRRLSRTLFRRIVRWQLAPGAERVLAENGLPGKGTWKLWSRAVSRKRRAPALKIRRLRRPAKAARSQAA
jgi:hypothetical protein